MRKKIGQVTLHLYRPKKSSRNGNYAPFIRIVFQDENMTISTRCEISFAEWDEYIQCPPENHPITIEWEKICDCVRELVSEGEFSLALLKEILRGGKKTSIQAFTRSLAEELKKAGVAVALSEVFALELDNEPGRAADAVKAFSEAGISITYMYSFLLRGKGILIFRTDNNEHAEEVITKNGLKSIGEEALAELA